MGCVLCVVLCGCEWCVVWCCVDVSGVGCVLRGCEWW